MVAGGRPSGIGPKFYGRILTDIGGYCRRTAHVRLPRGDVRAFPVRLLASFPISVNPISCRPFYLAGLDNGCPTPKKGCLLHPPPICQRTASKCARSAFRALRFAFAAVLPHAPLYHTSPKKRIPTVTIPVTFFKRPKPIQNHCKQSGK